MKLTFRLCAYTFFLAAGFLLMGSRGRLIAATLGPCLETCTGSTPCDTECLYNLDSEETCGDWGTCAPDCSEVCGPSVACDTGCSGGDGSDCGGYNGGKANSECYGTCGDGSCDGPELQHPCGCTADCGSGDCTPHECTPGSSSCGAGYVCTADGMCTAVDPGCSVESCNQASDCCTSGDICQKDPGTSSGWCAGIPTKPASAKPK